MNQSGKLKCPKCDVPLYSRQTPYGLRWQCPDPACDVACWDGKTSTPADSETRRLRHDCHEEFDPLWKFRIVWRTSIIAYRWLAKFMKLPPKLAHIGMFDADQCRRLLAELRRMETERQRVDAAAGHDRNAIPF